MLVKNVKLQDRKGEWEILIEEGKIAKIGKSIKTNDIDIIDGKGNLALSPFVEPHVHLDTTLSAGEPRWNLSGTLFEGIECWSERKKSLSEQDVISRAKKAISWQVAGGVQYIRTHVDTTDPDLIALKAMVKLREELKNKITLQIVAFPQEGVLSYPNGLELLEKSMDLGADVIGAIPHFEFTREYGVDSICKIMKLAKKRDCLVDVHCDEIDDEQSRFIEVLATKALEYGIGEKVTASHTTAMHSYNNAYTYKLFRLLKMSGISFVCNPLVNIHLQGRFDTYPKRRGLTRVPEMVEAGINVCFGHDDILDPWYPLGTGNMLQVLHMGLHVTQMMGYPELCKGIDLITTNSAKAMNIDDYEIKEKGAANLIILTEQNSYDALRLQAKVLYSIREGKVIARTEPSSTFVDLGEGEREENYRK